MEIKMEEIMTSLIQMNSKLEVLDKLKSEMSDFRKIVGDSMHPCLTPVSILTRSDNFPSFKILTP